MSGVAVSSSGGSLFTAEVGRYRVHPASTRLGYRHPGFAIREAVGQLMEYRHFLGPHDAQLCILLDGNPGHALTSYVEDVLGFLILWVESGTLQGGERTRVSASVA